MGRGNGNAVLTTQTVQNDPDLLFRGILLACRAFDVFDDRLASDFACSVCVSHLPLHGGHDEPETLSYQITLFGPIGADPRHRLIKPRLRHYDSIRANNRTTAVPSRTEKGSCRWQQTTDATMSVFSSFRTALMYVKILDIRAIRHLIIKNALPKIAAERVLEAV
jgi:hypothetical protein